MVAQTSFINGVGRSLRGYFDEALWDQDSVE